MMSPSWSANWLLSFPSKKSSGRPAARAIRRVKTSSSLWRLTVGGGAALATDACAAAATGRSGGTSDRKAGRSTEAGDGATKNGLTSLVGASLSFQTGRRGAATGGGGPGAALGPEGGPLAQSMSALFG